MTLIEVMVVLVIMVMISGAVAIGVMKSFGVAKKRETETRARTIQSAATAYLLEGNEGCPQVEELARADYLDRTTDPRDGWGHAFALECDGHTVHVRSAGEDGALGNDDDLGF